MYRVYRIDNGKQIDVSGYGMSLRDANEYVNKCRGNYPENRYVVMAESSHPETHK